MLINQSRDARLLYNAISASPEVRGVERYHLGLVPALASLRSAPSITVLTAPWQGYYSSFDGLRGVKRQVLDVPRSRLVRGIWQLGGAASRSVDYDLLYLGNVLPVPMPVRVPVISMVYDLIEFRTAPRHSPYGRTRTLFRRAVLRRIAQKSTTLVTMSEATTLDLIRILHVPSVKVVTIGTGTALKGDQQPIPSRDRKPALVFVGNLHRHKRLDLVLRAMTINQGFRLELVTSGGPDEQRLRSLAAELQVAHRLDWLGRLDDGGMLKVVRESAGLLMPSDNEGFGLPILEALSAGTPVIISSSLPFAPLWEAVGGPVFGAGDHRSLARVIDSFLQDSSDRDRLGAAGRQLVQSFSWEAVAGRLLRVLENALLTPIA